MRGLVNRQPPNRELAGKGANAAQHRVEVVVGLYSSYYMTVFGGGLDVGELRVARLSN